MSRKFSRIFFALVCLSASCFGTVAVSGNGKALTTSNLGIDSYVTFTLKGTGGATCNVSGAILQSDPITAAINGSGAFSATLYSNVAANGTGAGEITCGNSSTSTYYEMQLFVGGAAQGKPIPYRFKTGDSATIPGYAVMIIAPAGADIAPDILSIGTVSTLPYTSPATASVTGSAPNQILNFGIPIGAPGASSITPTTVLPTPGFRGTFSMFTNAAAPYDSGIYFDNGTSRTRLNADIDLKRDCKVVGDAATDDTTALNACFATYTSNVNIHCTGNMKIRVTGTILFPGWAFNKLYGDLGYGGSLDYNKGCWFLWDGPEAGVMADAAQMYHSTLHNLQFDMQPYWPGVGYVGANHAARQGLWFERVNNYGSNNSKNEISQVAVLAGEAETFAVASYTVAGQNVSVVTSVAHDFSATRAASDEGGDSACLTVPSKLCGTVTASADNTHFTLTLLAGLTAPPNCAASCGVASPRPVMMKIGDSSAQNAEFFYVHDSFFTGRAASGDCTTATPWADDLNVVAVWIDVNNAFNTHFVRNTLSCLTTAFHNTTNAVFENNNGETVQTVYESPGTFKAFDDDYEFANAVTAGGGASQGQEIGGASTRYVMGTADGFPGPVFDVGANTNLTLANVYLGAPGIGSVLTNGILRNSSGAGSSSAMVTIEGRTKFDNFAYDLAEASNYSHGAVRINKPQGNFYPTQNGPNIFPFGFTMDNDVASAGVCWGTFTPGSRGFNGGPASVNPVRLFCLPMQGSSFSGPITCADLSRCFGQGAIEMSGVLAPEEAPTATYSGTAGSTNWGFALASKDASGGNASPISPTLTWATTTGPADTDGTHTFTITFTHKPAGVTYYNLYRINPADAAKACLIRSDITLPYTLNATAPCLDNGASYANLLGGPYNLTNPQETVKIKGKLQLSRITGATQCLHTDTNGNTTGTGSDCISQRGVTTLTDGATITWAIGSVYQDNATVTLGGNRTLNITGPVTGGTYVLRVVQDGTGGRTLALGTGCTWKVRGGGAGAITLTAAAGAIDLLSWYYDGTNCYAALGANYN